MAVFKQKIPARYVNRKKLNAFLIKSFGDGKFEFEVVDDEFIIITLFDADAQLTDVRYFVSTTFEYCLITSLAEAHRGNEGDLFLICLLSLAIQSLLCEVDGEDRKFVPRQALYNLLTKDVVFDAVSKQEDIIWYHKDKVTDWIMRGGRRIFAILVVLKNEESSISYFIKHDRFQNTPLDDRLPFPKESLYTIIPNIADDFYDRQWEFASPILSRNVIHRVLPPKVRLPFEYNRQIDQGGFGKIFEIRLHPDHQTTPLLPPNSDQGIVRKEFETNVRISIGGGQNNNGEHQICEGDRRSNELHNLSILNELRHPNIIELLASYTHGDKHNFLFPLIRDGSLDALFRKARPAQFQSDDAFFTALCGLSSAIGKVHRYTLETLKIEMIGCHYDLKPKNILVQGATFILADFGLSKLKEATDSSKSLYEGGAGDYLAPECEDCDDGFERHTASRPSDIWSFGCIIAEILTYMRKGSDGIEEFKSNRKVKIGSCRMPAFYASIRDPNPAVAAWLSKLEAESDQSCGLLIQLVRSMLDQKPEARPNAGQVTSRLRFISVAAYVSLVHELYQTLFSKLPGSFEADAEWKRFKSWRWAFDSAVSDDDRWNQKLDAELNLMSILGCLSSIRDELRSTISRCEDVLSPLFTHLRLLGDQLLEIFPNELQMRTKAHWEINMVSSDELSQLEEIQEAFGRPLGDNRISILASIKRMSIIAAEHLNTNGSKLHVDSKFIKLLRPCGNHTAVLVRSEHDPTERQALIEWTRYDNQETHNFSKLLSRIEALASFLNSSTQPDEFHTLHCSAFTHDRFERAFGLIYDFPSQPDLTPRTLADIITQTAKYRERPTLGSRFRLARVLALSLSGFHKVGWLHKSISPYNILFFNPKDSKAAHWLGSPYVIGFNHSRQDDPLAFTAGPGTNKVTSRYYHPQYSRMRGCQVRYRLEFDYYSLGLVLLEVGLWETLESWAQNKMFSTNQDMLDELYKKRVPLLGHYMGTDYQDAVLACLKELGGNGGRGAGVVEDEDSDKGRTPEESAALQWEFAKLVVEPLEKCNA